MEYKKKSDLKVECIASPEDLEFFGVTFDDIVNRTEAGSHFLRKLKHLCAMTQNITWTNIAYTLNITLLSDSRISFEFSECLADYIINLRHSLAAADEESKGPIQEFIRILERSDEENGRKLIAHFEKNVRKKCKK